MKRLIIMILALLLIGCESINIDGSACPAIVEYTTEEQDEMGKLMENSDNIILNRFMIDYYNLREKIRICR